MFVTPAWAADFSGDRARVEAILALHDKLAPAIDDYMAAVADDLMLMPNGGPLVEGKAAYRKHVADFYASGTIHIRHEVLEVHSFAEVVIVRGRAVGSYTPPGGGATNTFETHNLFVFRREADGKLKVWQIIFNDAPKSS
ncbi:MAG TPA: nuclear transport factor 2 family protein [Steroidobacteraceae bacterium]|nr:nuclear transport factor 2 family protein [Steroidobacteraceae bacterium]